MNYLRRENSTSAYKAESIAARQAQREAKAEATKQARKLKAMANYRRQLALEAELREANAAARAARNGGDATPEQLAESRRLGELMAAQRRALPDMKGARALMESMRGGERSTYSGGPGGT